MGDALKAIIPMALASWLLPENSQKDIWVLLCGAAAFLGHLYPVYLKFKGGKGVATALGVFLFLNPWAVFLVLIIFSGVVARWRYISAASLSAAALMPPSLWILGANQKQIILALGCTAFIWFKHRANIGRLLRGEESRWGEESKSMQNREPPR